MTKIYFHSSGDIGESGGMGMVCSSECYKGKSISNLSYWYVVISIDDSAHCHMCIHIPVSNSFLEGYQNHTILDLTLMTSFNLNYFCKGTIPKNHILKD